MSSRSLPVLALCATVLLLSPLAVLAAPESAQLTAAEALQRLRDNTGGFLTRSTNPQLAYTLLRASSTQPLLQDNYLATPLDRALNFLSLNGAVLGVNDPLTELVLSRVATDVAGKKSVHLNQVHAGLPVFGARIVVHMSDRGITGVNGVFVPGLQSAPSSSATSVDRMRKHALQIAAKRHPGAKLSIESTRLMYYRSGLLEDRTGKNYLAYEAIVRGAAGVAIRDRIILDTARGTPINIINEIDSALNREIYTPNQDVPPLLTEGSASAPADQPLVEDDRTATSSRVPPVPYIVGLSNLYVFAGGTYDLYKNLFGREGYDDGATPPEAQVQKSVYLVNEQCPNAYWNGDSTNYCPGFDADDVVSHEWSHAYTEYTHGLVYQYQSGALNESYSDIFGETYDLTNGLEGPLGFTLTEGDYFENGGSRWVLGEDLSEVAAGILLRDMWDPDAFAANVPGAGIEILATPSPGSVITSPNYYCAAGDGGGVHTNSGVPNHAYAMLVDGKTFNGVTIPSIGMIKAAHIYFQASSQYQTPTTNFAQHADALEQSCQDLKGSNLNGFNGQPSGQTITQADCDAVAAAMLAVEMRLSPKEKCGYTSILQPEATTPVLCPSGQAEFADFSETWESGAIPATWTQTRNLAGDTEPQPFEWVISSNLPAPHTGKGVFADNNGFGTCAAGGDASASWSLETPAITVADDASFFKFTHLVQTEAGFDGGNLKYSVGGAAFAVVPAGAFIYNGHSGEFGAAPTVPGVPDPTGLLGGNNTNPLAGEAAWTGSDQGESSGSWGTTIVDLAALGADAGDSVKFRYDFGQDGCGGNLGWYVDDVAVVHCAVEVVPPPAEPEPVVPAPAAPSRSRFGGAFGLGLLLPLLGFAAWKRRRDH